MRMKRSLLLLALLLSTLTLWAERIDVATARKVAEQVAAQCSEELRSSKVDITLVYAAVPGQEQSLLRSGKTDGPADYFVFNLAADKGFVIVAGDDCAFPVIGYSDEGCFHPDNLSDNLRSMLLFYQNQITFATRQDIKTSRQVETAWQRYLSAKPTATPKRVVLLETAHWGQGEPFNRFTPKVNGERTVVGCTATAMAIVMNYHQYPPQAVNPPAWNRFSVEGKETSQRVTYDAYDWDNMLPLYETDSYTEAQGNAVAQLMFHCGANIKMDYGRLESGAYPLQAARALPRVFGYSNSIQFLTRRAYRWEEWKNILRQELDAGYPALYEGTPLEGTGHAFVCDGYDSDGLFHINWGWNGMNDGFFVLSVLDYDGTGSGYGYNQNMVIHIRRPELGGEKVYVPPFATKADYKRTGSRFHATFDIDYYALEPHDFYMELGVVNQEGKVVKTPSAPSKMSLLNYEDGWMSYQGYERTLTCAQLLPGERVTLICSDDREHWEVMRTEEGVAWGIDYDGVIAAEPDVPVEPDQPMVTSMTWNQLDDSYLTMTGLSSDFINLSNVKGVCYQLLHAKEQCFIRYTIHNYADWKEHLAISYASDYTMFEAGKSTEASVSDQGSFDVPINLSEIDKGYYIHYLNLLSDRTGQLLYDIEIYTVDSATPVFTSKDHTVCFVGQVLGEVTPSPIQGKVNDTIPASFVIDADLDRQLAGKSAELFFNLWGFQAGEVELYYVEDQKKQMIPLREHDDFADLMVSEESIPVAPIHPGKRYQFQLVCKRVPHTSDPYDSPFFYLYVFKVGGKYVPSDWAGSSLAIREQGEAAANEELVSDDVKVWSQQGRLHLQTSTAETAYIVTMEGRLHRVLHLSEGVHTLPLPPGIYLIRIGGKSYKVQL